MSIARPARVRCAMLSRRAFQSIAAIGSLASLMACASGSRATPSTAAGPQGQRSVREEARRATATREELDGMASEAEQIASMPQTGAAMRRDKLADAQALRLRLANGDFQAGDRIVLRISGDQNFKPEDTLSVRTGTVLVIQGLGEISLRGVLRSELSAYMKREVTRFVRGAGVTATSVVRLGVAGPVMRPGFHEFASEMLLSDAIMKIGGPVGNADLHNIVVQRGNEEAWGRNAIDVALQEGISIEQLGLKSGDQMIIGEKSTMNAAMVLQYLMIGFQLINMVLLLQVRR